MCGGRELDERCRRKLSAAKRRGTLRHFIESSVRKPSIDLGSEELLTRSFVDAPFMLIPIIKSKLFRVPVGMRFYLYLYIRGTGGKMHVSTW